MQPIRTCTPLRWRLDCQLVGRFSSTNFGEDALLDLHARVRQETKSETGLQAAGSFAYIRVARLGYMTTLALFKK